MKSSREPLLNLIEQTYDARHPDFDLIREQYKEIIGCSTKEEVQRD